MKACPFCAEEIQEAAIVCKHCGRTFAARAPSEPQPFLTQKLSGQQIVLGLLAAGALLFVFASQMPGGDWLVPSLFRFGAISSDGPTLAQFTALQTGMSYSEATSVLGTQGTLSSRSDMAGITTVLYTWRGSGSIGANMNAMFQNDHLIQKAQFGLR